MGMDVKNVQEYVHVARSHIYKHAKAIMMWGCVIAFCNFTYLWYYKPRYSIYLTLSSLLNLAAVFFMGYTVAESGQYDGISLTMIEFNMLVGVARMVSIIRHIGYLPNDDSGDVFYRF